MKEKKLKRIEERVERKSTKNELKECIEEHDLVGRVKGEINREKRRVKKERNRELNEPPKLDVAEEIGNSITHGVGALIGVAMLVLMIIFSKSTSHLLAGIFYGVSIIIMMIMSCLYHAFKGGLTVKRLWRRFDYASIYLLIGGTFSPLLLVELGIGSILGIVLFCVDWAIIIFGITMVCIFGPGRIKGLHFALYFVLGWIGILFIPLWIHNNRISLLLWILIGGLVYTLGMIPFAMKKIKNSHFIWHFFVLAGMLIQWLGIFFNIYC